MTLKELIMSMYYTQQVRVFECDYFDRTKKTLIITGVNQNLRSTICEDFANRKVIGFGVGEIENTVDINVEGNSRKTTNYVEDIIAKLKEMFPNKIQMFDCVGWTPDYKTTIYSSGKVKVLYAPGWDYVEVLGTTKEEFDVIFKECGY